MIKVRKFNEVGDYSRIKYKVDYRDKRQFRATFRVNKRNYFFRATAYVDIKIWGVGLMIEEPDPKFNPGSQNTTSTTPTDYGDHFKVLPTMLNILNDFLGEYKPKMFVVSGKQKSLRKFLQHFANDIEKYVPHYTYDPKPKWDGIKMKTKDSFGTYYHFQKTKGARF